MTAGEEQGCDSIGGGYIIALHREFEAYRSITKTKGARKTA